MAATKLTVASILLAASIISCCAAQDILPSAPTPTPNQVVGALTKWPTYWPTYIPTYTPTANDEELLPSVIRCPSSFESFVQIDDAASMQYSIVKSEDPLQSGIFCARLYVKSDMISSANEGWVAIGFSEDGNMPGSDAIVANLEEGSVLKYHLGDRDPAAVVLMEDQTLQDTYVGVHGSMAVVEFTKLLVEQDEVTINEDGVNIFLHARGDVWPGYHTSKKVFVDVVKKKRTFAMVCDETRPCPDGDYCKLEPGKCLDASESQAGICVRIHDNCNWPVSYLPICGCDGETYGNECEVDESGTSVAYEGYCEVAERQVDLRPTTPDKPCLENQCLDPDGECGGTMNCFADPCDVQDECAYAECEANYCGGCHHVCLTKVSDDIFCAEVWQPVCGDDNITYSNRCEASKVDNVNIMYEGECKDVDVSEPKEKCYPGGVCSTEGSSCSEGTETCCGQTYDSLKCDCFGGTWMCFHTDACLFPSCCTAGPPKDMPASSMEYCVSGSACDTEFDDDYCCNDFNNPGNTYCTKSGGMPPELTVSQPVTTEATTTAATTATAIATTTATTTTIAVTTAATTTTTTTNTTSAPSTGSPTVALTSSLTDSPSPAPIKLSVTASPTLASTGSPTAALTSSSTDPPSSAPIKLSVTASPILASTGSPTVALTESPTDPPSPTPIKLSVTVSPTLTSTGSPTVALTKSPTAPPIEAQTTSTEGTISTASQTTTAPTRNPTSASTSSPTPPPTSSPTPTAPPAEAQTTSTEGTITGTTTSSTYQTTSSAVNIASTTSAAVTNETSSTPHSPTTADSNTIALQTTSTSSTISVTLDNPVTSTFAADSGTESTGATASTTTSVPSTTRAFNFELGFTTTTTPESGSDLETTTATEPTTTEPTSLATGTIEGRSSTSAAEKSVFRLFSLSSICLALIAWNLM